MTETISELWRRLSQPQPVALDSWQWLVIALVVAVLVFPRPIWRLTGMYSTLVHELGHVITALFTGRFVTGLRLGWDHSGEVVSRGRGKFSVVISGICGYPAPIWCAAGLLAATAGGYAGMALGVYALFFCVALVFVRNWPALLVCLASSVTAVGVVLFAPLDAFIYSALLTAGFLFIAGLRDSLKLVAVHSWRRHDVRQSDAYLIAQSTGTFASLWLLVILVLSAGGVWVGANALLKMF